MIKHIVAWRLKQHAEGRNKAENACLAKQRLEALNGRIPGLLHLEVGIDFGIGDASSDLLLYSEFTDRASLDAYHDHPAHQQVVPFMLAIRDERRVVDYEVA